MVVRSCLLTALLLTASCAQNGPEQVAVAYSRALQARDNGTVRSLSIGVPPEATSGELQGLFAKIGDRYVALIQTPHGWKVREPEPVDRSVEAALDAFLLATEKACGGDDTAWAEVGALTGVAGTRASEVIRPKCPVVSVAAQKVREARNDRQRNFVVRQDSAEFSYGYLQAVRLRRTDGIWRVVDLD